MKTYFINRLLFLLSLLFLTSSSLFPQKYVQTLKGSVSEKSTNLPLVGVSLIIPGSNPVLGTISDENGKFLFSELPVGRYKIQVSYIGYQTITIDGIQLSSGKETFLNIELEEKVFKTDEVVVKAYKNKSKPINQIATVSARSFTVEETNRYAGSFGDPARMASNYAGVVSISTERNDIIIRGNSPIGLLWKLDDVEIPNPNHFGAMGTTGGPITILNHNFLSKSDFFTGAFPAQYSNALAGVFDLKMRSGNADKREYWAQLGWNGYELGLEGPIVKQKKATYLASYRYSMFETASKLGIDFYAPIYSDLTFKLDIPGKKYGRLSIFGIGGKSNMKLWDSNNGKEEWRYNNSGEDITFGSDFACIAISNIYYFKNKTRMKTNFSSVLSQNITRTDTFFQSPANKILRYGEKTVEIKHTLSGSLRRKVNVKNLLEGGYYLDLFQINYRDSVLKNNGYLLLSDTKGTMTMFRTYLQWKHKFSDNFVMTNGINLHYLELNEHLSIEPRFGITWSISSRHVLHFGSGLHGQTQPRLIYFYESQSAQNSLIKTNQNLDFSKSIHAILGYDFAISGNMRLKIESYYQYLYNIPVKAEGFPQYSLINSGGDFWVGREDSLVNEGTGKNKGIDFTLERFFKKNYYYLITLSLFDSKYCGTDNIERNTSFNQNYILNLLGGYEQQVNNKNLITINLKNVFAGGKRFVPIDIDKSETAGKTVYNWEKAYENRYKNFFRTDVRIGYKINMAKMSFVIAADLQNITNSKQPFMQYYDPSSGEIENRLQFGFLPMLTMKLEF